MPTSTRISDLSPGQQWLVRTMSEIGFGSIDKMAVRDGVPISDPPPEMRIEKKLGSDKKSRVKDFNADFALKEAVVDLINELERFGNGVVERIEVRDGLPFRLIIKQRGYTNQ